MPIPFKKDPMEFKQRALFATNVFDLLPQPTYLIYYRPIIQVLFTRTYFNNLTHQALKNNSAFVVKMPFIQG